VNALTILFCFVVAIPAALLVVVPAILVAAPVLGIELP
jgi:hypothetical protein